MYRPVDLASGTLGARPQAEGGSAFLVYLEQRQYVCWLQMSFSVAGGTNSAPPNSIAGLLGPIRGGGKKGERERKGGEEKGRKGREKREKTAPK